MADPDGSILIPVRHQAETRMMELVYESDSREEVLEKNNLFTKILVIVGNILIWIPLVLPFIFLIGAWVQSGSALFDFLIPAELFPATLIGALLLLWVSVRIKKRLAPVGWGAAFAILMLITGQVVASVSGLASGEAEQNGAVWFIALGSIILFDLALVFVGIHGILLLKDLIKDSRNDRIQED